MAATIRLQKMGRKKQISFRIVVADPAESRDGPAIETLGIYNPRVQPSLVRVDAAATLHWLYEGARPTDTVRSLLRKTGVWQKFQDGVGADELEETVVTVGPPEGARKTSDRARQAAAAVAARPVSAPAKKAEVQEDETKPGEAATETEVEAEAAAETEAEAEAAAEPAAEVAAETVVDAPAEEATEPAQDAPEPPESEATAADATVVEADAAEATQAADETVEAAAEAEAAVEPEAAEATEEAEAEASEAAGEEPKAESPDDA